MIPTAASTIAKYTHAIAEAGPYCQSLCKSRIRPMTTLFGSVFVSFLVMFMLAWMMGLT